MLSDVPTGPLTLHFSLWCQVSYQQAEVFRESHSSMESAGNNWSIHAPETLVNASHTSPLQLPLGWAPNVSPCERKLGKGGLEWISKVRIYFANSTKIRWPCEHHSGPWETPVQKWRGWLWIPHTVVVCIGPRRAPASGWLHSRPYLPPSLHLPTPFDPSSSCIALFQGSAQ